MRCGRSPHARAPFLPGYPAAAPREPAPPASPRRGDRARPCCSSLAPPFRHSFLTNAKRGDTGTQHLLEPRSLQAAAARASHPGTHWLSSLGAGSAPRAPERSPLHGRRKNSTGASIKHARTPLASQLGRTEWGWTRPGAWRLPRPASFSRPPARGRAARAAGGSGGAELPLLAAWGNARGGGRGARPALPGPRRRRFAGDSVWQAAVAGRPSPSLPL